LIVVAAVFALLLMGRVGGARRYEIQARWPSLLFAVAAILALSRGAVWPALALGAFSALAWILWPSLAARRSSPARSAAPDAAEVEARAVLGVGPNATESEIRSAYRAKMTRAHPDLGGGHAEAARLTAARDRLLRKKR
jgi:hypothetical protein